MHGLSHKSLEQEFCAEKSKALQKLEKQNEPD